MNVSINFTRNELASLAHSFYTCLKHKLMHQLYSSALYSYLGLCCMLVWPARHFPPLPFYMLRCMHDVGFSLVITF